MRKILTPIMLLFILLFSISGCSTKRGHGYDVRFFGIDSRDFEDREILPVVVGGLVSYENGPAVWADEYDNKSKSDKLLFHAGGFITQFVIGSALTAVPYTRHSDFAVGYTGFTFIENTLYGITGGIMDDEYSDVDNLNDLGYQGNAIAIGAGLYSGVLTYINLNKHKEEKPKRKNCDLIEVK